MPENTALKEEGSAMPLVVPLNAVGREDASQVGAKAANLGEALRAGFPVPPGVVVTTQAFADFLGLGGLADTPSPEAIERSPVPEDLAQVLQSSLEALGDVPLAVRSSGVEEDLPGASFAGQYETVLGVRGPDGAVDAVRRCWASAFAPRVLAYRREHGLSGPPRMAVLVQQLVPAEAAGVAFTANPLTGDRGEVVVESVSGLGERLVSGTVNADEWVVKDGRAVCRRAAERAIRPEHALEVAGLARRVESHFGVPQDVEWALSAGRLYLLQARPITALPVPVDWTPTAPGAWIRNLRLGEWLGEPLTPLFETWLVERLDEALWAHLHGVIRAPTPEPHHVVVNGYYYATANFLPKNRAAMAWFGVRYFLPGLLLRPRRVAVIFPGRAYWGMQTYEQEWRGTVLPRYRAVVQHAEARVEECGSEELLALVDRAAEAAGLCFVSVTALAGSAWKPEYALASFYRKHLLPRIGGSHLPLVLGLGDGGSGTSSYAAPNLDWSRPTLGELGSLEPTVVPADRRTRLSEARHRAEAASRRALAGSPRRARTFERLLARAQWAAVIREEVASQFTLGWPVMRRALLRLGGTLRSNGSLAKDEDVFFLTRDELVAAIRFGREDPTLGERAGERRTSWERERRLAPPLELGELSPLARGMLSRFERTLGERAQGGSGVRGFPASPGRATGPARIIRSIEDFGRFREGDVLVAPATNPAWTPLFARAAAVVTDTGSLMAHASLVAREYAIPAVVGAGNATARIRDGEVVTVDGGVGSVEWA